jgi:hypothetical protein
MDPAEKEKFETVRKALEALTPEQRKRFQDNLIRWSSLSPEDKTALAGRDSIRKKRMAEEIDAAIAEAGLELNAEQRDAFTKRYGEERRKLEEQLRKEADEKRKPLLKEVIAKLKGEFSSSSGTAAAQAPGTTPAPVVSAPTPAKP